MFLFFKKVRLSKKSILKSDKIFTNLFDLSIRLKQYIASIFVGSYMLEPTNYRRRTNLNILFDIQNNLGIIDNFKLALYNIEC
jgi:hypothetical protein